jgi:hypothetical protein
MGRDELCWAEAAGCLVGLIAGLHHGLLNQLGSGKPLLLSFPFFFLVGIFYFLFYSLF